MNRLHALECTVVAIAGFLLGLAVRVDGNQIWRMLDQWLGF